MGTLRSPGSPWLTAVISAPLDLALWRPTLAHPDFPFTSPWQLAWPELSALYFNVGQNKAAEWGVQPATWYFTHALPKICLASLPLAVIGLVSRLSTSDMSRKAGKAMSGIDEIAGQFGLGVFVLLCGMSSIGHKVRVRCKPRPSTWLFRYATSEELTPGMAIHYLRCTHHQHMGRAQCCCAVSRSSRSR